MRIVAYVPDLLFGSGVVSSLQAAGHQTALVGDSAALRRELGGSQLLIVDLTADPQERIASTVKLARGAGVPMLAFYSHVETDVKAAAEQAGFDLIVPRSRMAREGVALVERFSERAAEQGTVESAGDAGGALDDAESGLPSGPASEHG